MRHSIEDLIEKINAMKDMAVLLHRERNRYSDISGQGYDKKACNHLLESIQAMALDIANDKQGDEILTDMEYKK
jgi:uncharacterized protein (UPF0335 family)